MKIAVNTRLLIQGKMEGIGWYTYEVLKNMVNQHPEDDFIFIFDRPYHPSFIFGDNVIPVVIGPPARHPILFKVWFDLSLPKILKKYQADVFFSPDGFTSLSFKGKSVITLHDLAYLHYPQYIIRSHLWYYRHYMPKFLTRAQEVITISNAIADEILHYFPQLNPKKIHVIPNGVRDVFGPVQKEMADAIKAELFYGQDFFLFVGAMHPRKNIERIVQAFELYRDRGGKVHKLLFCGRLAWKSHGIKIKIQNSKYHSDIKIMENTPNEQLIKITASAWALLYPSLYEGFGLPILEGFKSKVPVLTSNKGSMKEVAQDAAICVNPESTESICEGMFLLEDNTLREQLTQKALLRLPQYDWNTTAEEIYSIIQKAAQT